MTLQFGTTLRNTWLDDLETVVGVSGVVEVRSGAQPANCAAANSGTLLIEYDLASDWMAAASAGAKSMSGTPIAGTGAAAGTVGHFRIFDSTKTTCHMQGSCGVSGTDMLIDNAVVAVGQTINITGFTLTAPGA